MDDRDDFDDRRLDAATDAEMDADAAREDRIDDERLRRLYAREVRPVTVGESLSLFDRRSL